MKAQSFVQQESFELILNTDTSSLTTDELIKYLSNTDQLIRSINDTLNTEYTVGFDRIEVDVLAIEKGSFKIPFRIKKITENSIIQNAVGNVIGGLIICAITNSPNPQIINAGEDTVSVTSQELLSNRKTRKTLCSMANQVINDDNISDISIVYKNVDNIKEKVTINKEQLSQIKNDEPEDNVISSIENKVKLEIVSPVFLEKPTAWKVLYKQKNFSAKMLDEDFLDTINLQKISFAKGDVIIADLETVATKHENGIRLTHNIIKVHSYPKYQRVIKEPNLFSSKEEI